MINPTETQYPFTYIDQEFNTSDYSIGIYSDQELFDHETVYSSGFQLLLDDIPSECTTPDDGILAGVHTWNLEDTSTTENQHITSTRRKKFTKRMTTPYKTNLHRKLFQAKFEHDY